MKTTRRGLFGLLAAAAVPAEPRSGIPDNLSLLRDANAEIKARSDRWKDLVRGTRYVVSGHKDDARA